LLATARLDGLDPSQFKTGSLGKALRRLDSSDSDDVTAASRTFDEALVRYVSALRSGAAHVRATWRHWNWRDRCAYAGYYCLYAWDGYVYSYPFDDRPSAYAYSARRHRHRF